MDEKAAETWTTFSLKFLSNHYTPESVEDDIYLEQNDSGYICTNNTDIENDHENFGRYCFIQETVKCFQGQSCDIENHNEILTELYSASKNVPKMLFHIAKHFIKEKFGQAKHFFQKLF
uniref:Uncharacterized protein n=1 Tax=Panagrolaimus sp. ES5 TaxID=591445 RepID=A0AC34G673_9BILA